MSTKFEIRHSHLPKLAACPRWRPKPGPAGPAAQRGTAIDAAVRAALQGDPQLLEGLPEGDKGPAQWAVALLLDYKRTGELETREEFLAMHTPGIAHVGTADVVNMRLQWVADLKTGQIRNYYHQLAAYALALMERTFAQDWTGHVVYCDDQRVVSYLFSYAEAKRAVEQVLAEVRDPNAQPRACEYCDWCALKDSCPAVVKPVEEGLQVVYTPRATLTEMRDKLIASPRMLAEFVAQWKAVEKEIAEFAIDRLKELLEAGEEVPGWKLSKTAGSEYYDTDGILFAAKEASAPLEGMVKALGGKMSAKVYKEWCAEIGFAPLASHVRRGKETTRLLQDRKKQKQLSA